MTIKEALESIALSGKPALAPLARFILDFDRTVEVAQCPCGHCVDATADWVLSFVKDEFEALTPQRAVRLVAAELLYLNECYVETLLCSGGDIHRIAVVIDEGQYIAAYPLNHGSAEDEEILCVLAGVVKDGCFAFLRRECPHWRSRLPWTYRLPRDEWGSDRAFRYLMQKNRDDTP